MKRKITYRLLCILLIASFVASCSRKTEDKELADEENAGKVIIETGELAAINTKSFVMMRFGRYWYQMRIIGILEHGTIVEEGDSIIQFDPADIQKFIIDKESNLENQLATLEKMKVDQLTNRNERESQIRNELATFNLKKLELESSRFESERQRKIKQLEFRQAEITLAKERRKRELSEIIDANNLKVQEITVKQIKTEIDDAIKLLPTLTLRTPVAGVFQVARNHRTGNPIRVGDNIYNGNNMANVPELKRMKVNTQVNETDFLKIKPGQKVIVRLDALPKITFEGEVAHIAKLCRRKDEKSRLKVFDVEVTINDYDERLKPGMTVSCEFVPVK